MSAQCYIEKMPNQKPRDYHIMNWNQQKSKIVKITKRWSDERQREWIKNKKDRKGAHGTMDCNDDNDNNNNDPNRRWALRKQCAHLSMYTDLSKRRKPFIQAYALNNTYDHQSHKTINLHTNTHRPSNERREVKKKKQATNQNQWWKWMVNAKPIYKYIHKHLNTTWTFIKMHGNKPKKSNSNERK